MPTISVRVTDATRDAARWLITSPHRPEATSLNDWIVQLLEEQIEARRRHLPESIQMAIKCTTRFGRPGRLKPPPPPTPEAAAIATKTTKHQKSKRQRATRKTT